MWIIRRRLKFLELCRQINTHIKQLSRDYLLLRCLSTPMTILQLEISQLSIHIFNRCRLSFLICTCVGCKWLHKVFSWFHLVLSHSTPGTNRETSGWSLQVFKETRIVIGVCPHGEFKSLFCGWELRSGIWAEQCALCYTSIVLK